MTGAKVVSIGLLDKSGVQRQYFPNWLDYSDEIQGWMSRDELQWLHEQAASRQVIVECGVWKGRSTSAIAAGTQGIVYAVDRWQGTGPYEELNDPNGRANVKSIAESNLSRFPNVRLVDSPSYEAMPMLLAIEPNLRIQMLFLDSDHDYDTLRLEMDHFAPYMAGNALWGGHDYSKGVKRAVDERFGVVQRGPGSIWWVQN